MIQLGVTLPPELADEAQPIAAGTLLLMTLVLFGCSLISFGIGAPTGGCDMQTPYVRSVLNPHPSSWCACMHVQTGYV